MKRYPWEDSLKYKAGEPLVDMIDWDQPIAFGAGSTVQAVLRFIYDKRIYKGKPVACGSRETEEVAIGFGMDVVSSERLGLEYVYIDGTDQFDPDFNLLKGGDKKTGNPGQEGCMKREKEIAKSSGRFIVVCDDSKKVDYLGYGGYKLPVEYDLSKSKMALFSISEVMPMGGSIIKRRDTGGVAFKTESDNRIYDVSFKGTDYNLKELETELKMCTGVIETGLFANNRPHNIIVSYDDRVEVLDMPR